MARVYSAYDAKARFSEVLGRVRAGQRVVVTWHGKPVAEIRPIEREVGLDARLQELRDDGQLTAPPREDSRPRLAPLSHRPGSLKRFLGSRE